MASSYMKAAMAMGKYEENLFEIEKEKDIGKIKSKAIADKTESRQGLIGLIGEGIQTAKHLIDKKKTMRDVESSVNKMQDKLGVGVEYDRVRGRDILSGKHKLSELGDETFKFGDDSYTKEQVLAFGKKSSEVKFKDLFDEGGEDALKKSQEKYETLVKDMEESRKDDKSYKEKVAEHEDSKNTATTVVEDDSKYRTVSPADDVDTGEIIEESISEGEIGPISDTINVGGERKEFKYDSKSGMNYGEQKKQWKESWKPEEISAVEVSPEFEDWSYKKQKDMFRTEDKVTRGEKKIEKWKKGQQKKGLSASTGMKKLKGPRDESPAGEFSGVSGGTMALLESQGLVPEGSYNQADTPFAKGEAAGQPAKVSGFDSVNQSITNVLDKMSEEQDFKKFAKGIPPPGSTVEPGKVQWGESPESGGRGLYQNVDYISNLEKSIYNSMEEDELFSV